MGWAVDALVVLGFGEELGSCCCMCVGRASEQVRQAILC